MAGQTVISLVNHQQRVHGTHRWPYEYKTYGNASLPTVVLVPGLDGCTSFFADVVPELTVNFHVIMFYLPLAPGPFDEPLPEGETYSFEFLARSLKRVLIKTGKLRNVHLVGESFGGVVAQRFALMEPDTLSSLTIISSLCRTELTPTVAFKVGMPQLDDPAWPDTEAHLPVLCLPSLPCGTVGASLCPGTVCATSCGRPRPCLPRTCPAALCNLPCL